MEVTLEEAAARLGKNVRQVRYMVSQKTLPARKQGRRWLISEEALPTSSKQKSVAGNRRHRLERKVERVLNEDDGTSRSYSVQSLRAFQTALPIYKQAENHLGMNHQAVGYLYECIEHIAMGCHRYLRNDKAAAYREARDLAARSVSALLLLGNEETRELSDTLEHELMPTLVGLLKRSEGHSRR